MYCGSHARSFFVVSPPPMGAHASPGAAQREA